MQTYCNPLNINYRFQVKDWADKCLREAADPSLVLYKDKYWLFPSKSGGYWYSDDLLDWTFVETSHLPVEDYAPDVRVINDMIYFTASHSKKDCPVFRTSTPESDDWELVADAFIYWDPNMFQDDDGKVYFYWGCSNTVPVKGVEMDIETMQPIGEPVALLEGNTTEHGWERTGENYTGKTMPFIEGAWMTKHAGKYYLQYAGPGTEWNTYADGVYESTESPLGPFTYAKHNPFSLKPGGFITGAGHGSTFTDKFGNLWHIATMRISVKHDFERRVGMFPAGFDKDGILFCNNSFGDYPTRVATGTWNALEDVSPQWMLLSYNKPVKASSSLTAHPPALAVNENVRTFWSAETGNPGEWLEVDLGNECTVQAIQVNFAEHECDCYGRDHNQQLCHQYHIEASPDGEDWKVVIDKRDNNQDVPHDYIELETPLETRYLRIVNKFMPAKGTFAISGFRIFGNGNGEKPEQVSYKEIKRDATSSIDAFISWEAAKNADGYNLLWGISPDKLYNSWLLYDQNELELKTLNADTEYWIRIDSFNENGITKGETVKLG